MKVFCLFEVFLDGDDYRREELLGVYVSKDAALRVRPEATERKRDSVSGFNDLSRNVFLPIIEQLDVQT